MATVPIAVEVLEELVFGYTENPINIVEIKPSQSSGYFDFEIEGEDVPDAPRVVALCNLQTNRAGQKLIRMTFESEREPLPLTF